MSPAIIEYVPTAQGLQVDPPENHFNSKRKYANCCPYDREFKQEILVQMEGRGKMQIVPQSVFGNFKFKTLQSTMSRRIRYNAPIV